MSNIGQLRTEVAEILNTLPMQQLQEVRRALWDAEKALYDKLNGSLAPEVVDVQVQIQRAKEAVSTAHASTAAVKANADYFANHIL